MKGGKCMMKILNNKIAVVGILAFLSLVVIALSGYMVYMLNTKEECFRGHLSFAGLCHCRERIKKRPIPAQK